MGVYVRPFSEHYQREALLTKGGECRENPKSSCSFPDSTASSFWSQARRSLQNLKKILSDPTADNPLAATTLLAETDIGLDEYMLSKIGKKRQVSYEVSNIGTFVQQEHYDGKEVSVLEMGRAIFSQSAVAMTTPLKVSVATGVDGRLNLGVTWQAGGVVTVAGDQDYKQEEIFVVEGLIRGLRTFIEQIVGRKVSE
jgi:Alcohol acetyltransferase